MQPVAAPLETQDVPFIAPSLLAEPATARAAYGEILCGTAAPTGVSEEDPTSAVALAPMGRTRAPQIIRRTVPRFIEIPFRAPSGPPLPLRCGRQGEYISRAPRRPMTDGVPPPQVKRDKVSVATRTQLARQATARGRFGVEIGAARTPAVAGAPSSRRAGAGERQRPLSRGQHAELMAIRIGHDHPADLTLADVDAGRRSYPAPSRDWAATARSQLARRPRMTAARLGRRPTRCETTNATKPISSRPKSATTTTSLAREAVTALSLWAML
jgi:hypothetical protein